MLYSRHVQTVDDSCHVICALKSHEWWTDVVKVACTYKQWYRIKEIVLKN